MLRKLRWPISTAKCEGRPSHQEPEADVPFRPQEPWSRAPGLLRLRQGIYRRIAENARQERAHARPLPIERPGMWADAPCMVAAFGAIRGLALWARPRAKYKRAIPVRKIGSNRVPCAHFSPTSYRLPLPASLLLIAGRKSWIELSRVLFLDGLVWHRLRVRPARRSCRRIVGADGLIDGGVRSIRLTGGFY
jgi:hypothetical protein